MKTSYLVSGSGNVTVFQDGEQFTIDKTHVNYSKVVDKLKKKQFDGLKDLLDVKKSIVSATSGKVEIKDGVVFYAGEAVHNYVATAILNFLRDGFDVKPLMLFLENLMQNPSKKSVDNLFRFLETNKHPITDDGCFIAYKRVASNYKDLYKGKFDNTPGKVVSMPRNEVEDDPNQTCAAGLHVANVDYAMNHYNSGTGRLVVCKVNPKDVVSVPTDYNNAKMRVCEYLVLEDYTKDLTQKDVVPLKVYDDEYDDDNDGHNPNWDKYDDDDDDDDDCDDCDDDDCDGNC